MCPALDVGGLKGGLVMWNTVDVAHEGPSTIEAAIAMLGRGVL
jgi:hypothetical protein